jgi:hypothetical protein
MRGLQDSGICVCSSASLEKGIRAPTEDEFLVAYNDTVTDLAEQGILTNVGSVGGVAGTEEVACPSEVSEFDTKATLQLSGNPDAVSISEIFALEFGKCS